MKNAVLKIAQWFTHVIEYLLHLIVYRSSLSQGDVSFGDIAISGDGQVLVHDTYFNSIRALSFHFEDRWLRSRNLATQTAIVYNALLRIDGQRVIGIVKGNQLHVPYGPAQPLPERFKKALLGPIALGCDSAEGLESRGAFC